MKKNIGAFPALYPTPLTLVGAMVDGKPSWMTVAHVGVIGHDRILISCAKIHYTNKGIRRHGVVSVSLVDEAMLPKADCAGSVSGHRDDKSRLFEWTAGETGAPIPTESPLVMECRVADNYETETFDNFILEIKAVWAEEGVLTADGKPNYEKIAPILFEFPTYTYLRTGKRLGKCLSFAGTKR